MIDHKYMRRMVEFNAGGYLLVTHNSVVFLSETDMDGCFQYPVVFLDSVKDYAEGVANDIGESIGVYYIKPRHIIDVQPKIDYKRYICSPEWKEKADAAKTSAGWRCQLCNSKGQLHAHHRTYERLGIEEPGDITVLCADCHARFHGVTDG